MQLDELIRTIRALLDNDETQQEMSARTGVSQQTISIIRKGQTDLGKMRLDTLLKLFPRAEIALDGSPAPRITAGRDAAGHDIVQASHGGMTFASAYDALADAGLCDGCLVKAMSAIRKAERGF